MKTKMLGGISLCLAVVFLSAICHAQRLPITCTFSIGPNPPRGTTLRIIGGPANAPVAVYGGFGTDLGVLVSAKGATTDANGNYTLFIPPASTVFRIALTNGAVVTHYRRIIRGNVNVAWPPGAAPPPVSIGAGSLQSLNGLPFEFSLSSFFTDSIGTIDSIVLGNLSSQHYAFTNVTVYQNLNMAYFNQAEFDSSQAISSGVLFYQDLPNTVQDNSEYTNVAGIGATGFESYIGFVPQPFQAGTYALLVGTAAVLNPDGSIGPQTSFAYANTEMQAQGADEANTGTDGTFPNN